MWQSPDPILGGYLSRGDGEGIYDPVNFGLYTYAGHNPLIYIDPDGNEKVIAVELSIGLQVGVSGKIGPVNVNASGNLGSYAVSNTKDGAVVKQGVSASGSYSKFSGSIGKQRSAPLKGRIGSMTEVFTKAPESLKGVEFTSGAAAGIKTGLKKTSVKHAEDFDSFGEGHTVIGVGAKAIIGLDVKVDLEEFGSQLGLKLYDVLHSDNVTNNQNSSKASHEKQISK